MGTLAVTTVGVISPSVFYHMQLLGAVEDLSAASRCVIRREALLPPLLGSPGSSAHGWHLRALQSPSDTVLYTPWKRGSVLLKFAYPRGLDLHIKLLEGNVGEYLWDLRGGKGFLDKDAKAVTIKKKKIN